MPKKMNAEGRPDFPVSISSKLMVGALLVCSVFALTLIFALRIYSSWKYADDLDQVSGIWAAMASDLSHGTFYRPLYSEALGYGGARYFPLHFVLLGELMRFGNIVTVGHLLDLTALLLLLAGGIQMTFAFWRSPDV